jgi:hypothetical protein
MSAKCQMKVSQVQQIELNEKRNEKDDYTEAYNLVKEAIMNSSRNEKEELLVPWGEDGKYVTEEFVKNSHKWNIDENERKYRPSQLYSRNAKQALKNIKQNIQRKKINVEFPVKNITFRYSKSNPTKIRQFEVEREDGVRYYGCEIENGQRVYKVFLKKFVNFCEANSVEQVKVKKVKKTATKSATIPPEVLTKKFYYKKSNPTKLRTVEVVSEDEFYVCGYEVENGNRIYKKFSTQFVEYEKSENPKEVKEIGEKINESYINNSFIVENRSRNLRISERDSNVKFVIQKILKGNEIFYLKINVNDIQEISNSEYQEWVDQYTQ